MNRSSRCEINETKALIESAKHSAISALITARQQKRVWQVRLALRRWSNAALKHFYKSLYLGDDQSEETEVVSFEEIVALFSSGSIFEDFKNDMPDCVSRFAQQNPLVCRVAFRLLVRLPEMTQHVNDEFLCACCESQQLSLEQLDVFCSHVFNCWQREIDDAELDYQQSGMAQLIKKTFESI